jgi:hypothetical protein
LMGVGGPPGYGETADKSESLSLFDLLILFCRWNVITVC